MERPSEKYRLMIYFAHATMCIYQKSIVSNEKMTVADFVSKNEEVCKRVSEEALSIFNYELSVEQMERAAYSYLYSKYNADSVKETEAFSLT